MHSLHQPGYAKTEANYHEYYRTLNYNDIVNRAASSDYLTTSYVPVKIKCIFTKRTKKTCGMVPINKRLISQSCPLCPQLDNALRILSGC